jgi:TonB family protein
MMAIIVEAALRSLLIGVIVWLAATALRLRNPHVLRTLWTGVLVVALLMPALMQLRLTAVLPARAAASTISILATPGIASGGWARAAGLAYGIVSLVLAIRLVLGTLLMWRKCRSSWRVPETSAHDVRLCGDLAAPVTFGSTILLPREFDQWPEAKRRMVLAHEQAHVRQYDAYVQWCVALHGAVFWFSPLAWWLRRQLTRLAEQASDEAVLREGADPQHYARVLLEFARARVPMPAAPAMSSGTVAGRIERIISGAPAAAPLSRWRKVLLLGALLPVVAAGTELMQAPGASATEGHAAIIGVDDLKPFYPPAAMHAGIEGSVQIAVTLDEAGRPTDSMILSESPPGQGFGAAASAAVHGAMRYRNPTGHPTTLTFNVAFRLDHSPDPSP